MKDRAVGEAYCVLDEETDIWHAVLGDYDPDVDGWAPPAVPRLASESLPAPTAQRLCDQKLLPYKHVSLRFIDGSDPLTVCIHCRRIKGLMVEFTTKYPEVEDGISGSNGIEQAGAP